MVARVKKLCGGYKIFMNFKTRSSNITKVLFIVLALCIISIMCISIYSMFNQNGNDNRGGLNSLSANDDRATDESEDAILDWFRRSPTEAPTEPPTQAPPVQRPTERPTERPAEPEMPVNPAVTPPVTPDTSPPSDTNRTADIVITPEEPAVEVLSVPTFYIRPVAGFVSKRHNPDVPEFSVGMNDYRTHTGIDIDSEIGVNVRAVAEGVVSEIYEHPLLGTSVVIDHAGGIQSVYRNLQEALPRSITVGARVSGGDIVGSVGQTALIEAFDIPHLHFEMKKDGSYIDPLDYLQ